MTLRFACDARGRSRKQLLDQIIKQADGQLECVLHFGDRDADYHAPCLQRMEVRQGKKGHLIANTLHKGANIDLLASPDFHQLAATAIDQLQRNDSHYRYRSHDLHNLQDYLDYYHILSDAIAQELQASGATHVLFMMMPHLAYDMVLYQVAQAMGLKVIVMNQTNFPNRWFSMANLDDMGHFEWSSYAGPPEEIEKGSEPDLFFMDKAWQAESARGRISPAAVAQVFKYTLLRTPLKALNPVYLWRTLSRVSKIYKGMPDWRDPFAKFFHTGELAFYEHLTEYETPAPDLDAPFIYVPLHNQPEMTTSTLGGEYRDQIRMVETLARSLPEGWKIYIKENPRQASFARGPMFFHRMARIPGVHYVPSTTATSALSSKAKLTATVVGSAGWESLRKGKPVVTFGRAWYRDLPGAHPWHADLDLAKVAQSTFDHAQLEKAAGALMSRAHTGIIDDIFINMVDGFDRDENVAAVATTVVDLLTGAQPLTFGPSSTAQDDPSHG